MRRLYLAAVLLVPLPLGHVSGLEPPQPPAIKPPKPTVRQVVESARRAAQPKPVSDPIERIKEEGLKHSQVMPTLSYLTDVIGPRLTGSPNLRRANEWTRDRLRGWGLQNAHLEPWGPFGRGWSLRRFSAQVVEPQCIPLIAYPKAWSPGTKGPYVGDVVYFDAKTPAAYAKYHGKLKGAIVLTGPMPELKAHFEPLAARLTDKELLELANAPDASPRLAGLILPGPGSKPVAAAGPRGRLHLTPQQRALFRLVARGVWQSIQERKKVQFLTEEGAAVLVDPSRTGDEGTLFVAAATPPGGLPFPLPLLGRATPWDQNPPKMVPQLVAAAEHYNRMVRMIRQGQKLKMAVDLAVQFHDRDLMASNTIAEIPGTDLKDELVMLGGHLDSWHSGTGATDNGAGVAVAMEAVRIIQALKLKPRRTIRVALWTGEEQGLLGSRAYVAAHFGTGGGSFLSIMLAGIPGMEPARNIRTKPEYDKLAAYFNLDNGTGKIRGLYLQGNEAVRPIFRQWLVPFQNLGASTLTPASTGGTDHASFEALGLPGFEFIQDQIEYFSRTHHSNQDVFDRIQADDLKQAATIMAAFVYNTAMRSEKLPRKPRPAERANGPGDRKR